MTYLWAGFLVLILFLLALDLGVFHKDDHVMGVKEATRWTAFWIALGLSFSGVIYLIYANGWFGVELTQDEGGTGGLGATTLYVTSYLLEKSLSVDNIFVIAMVFDKFGIERRYRHRVLYWGIVGALVLRAVMIFGGIWLVQRFSWIFYFFGAWLIWQGIDTVRGGDEDVDPEETFVFRAASKLLPIRGGEHHGHFTHQTGSFDFTILALTLVVIEWTDVAFAMDSVPAVLAITTESFIVFTSNIFAILGLRSLYFVLEGALEEFDALKYALAAILVFIGLKMLLHGVVHVPNLVSLGVIVGVLVIAVIAERIIDKRKAAAPEEAGGDEAAPGGGASGRRGWLSLAPRGD